MKEPLARIHVSPTQQRAAELFAFFADAIQFLGRTAWPVVDLIVRFWIAMPAIVSGLLMANDWNTALMLAINEYPIPWLDPRTEALLGIVVQLAVGTRHEIGSFGNRRLEHSDPGLLRDAGPQSIPRRARHGLCISWAGSTLA